ncbi:hypothetical protein BDW62DRAFT_196636 [Aspergillus aurantiobrunneus]
MASGLKAEQGRALFIVSILFGVLAVASVAMRFVSRRMRSASLGLDDYIMFVAIWLIIAGTVLTILTVTHGGIGLHAQEAGLDAIMFAAKMVFILQVVYAIGLSLVKTSLMVLYYHLFGIRKSFRIAIYVVGTIVWLWAFCNILESMLVCRPISANWDPAAAPSTTCGNRKATFIVSGFWNMITDFMVMLLPVPYIWGLQLPLGRKIGLIVTFCLGLFISATTVARVFGLIKIDFMDMTSTGALPLVWTVLEMNLSVIAANLPVLRHVFAAILPRGWMGSSRRDAADSEGHYHRSDAQRYNSSRVEYRMDKLGAASIKASAIKQSFKSKWRDEDRSDTTLADNGAPPGGIQVSRDFRVD